MTEREQLEAAIAALEAQRAILGDAVVEASLGAIRAKLATLTTPAEPEQRKLVTVLFADVSGFTAMAETRDAEEVREIINLLWGRLDTAITAHGGTIDKHIGDAVMALFGTPLAHEDDPERAVRAALDMQAALHALAADAAESSGFPALRMRIGINTGPVLLGTIGTTGEFTAMGDAVNLASRIEHAAPVGGILISHDTFRHVRGLFDVQPQEPLEVKGKADPIQTYVVVRARPRTFTLSTRGIEGVETALVGREAELRVLQEALTEVGARRQARVITVAGEAGMGKSRLLAAFIEWAEGLPQTLWYFKGRARQETEGLPYALIRDLFATRFAIADSDPPPVARAKLEVGMNGIGGASGEKYAHFLGHLIGFDFAHSPHLHGILNDARQIRGQAFHYAGQLFARLAQEDPVVLLVEDIHWADPDSLDLLEHLAGAGRATPLLIVALTRPTLLERRPTWGLDLDLHSHLDLGPLPPAAGRELAAALLQKAAEVPPALLDLVTTTAEGNPYYIEELIGMLIDDGVIDTSAATWQIAAARLAELRVPPTLAEVLQARLDSLPPAEHSTIQCAAVVGRVFWDDAVASARHAPGTIADAPEHLNAELSVLRSKALVGRRVPSAFAGTEEYLFKHALLRDVAYESVLMRQRGPYHAAVAAWLLMHSGERADELAGLIGYHYEHAGDAPQAAAWYARAGRQAQATYAPQAAIGYYQKALALWPDDAEHRPARLGSYAGLGKMLEYQARYSEAIQVYEEMEQTAAAAGDRRAEVQARLGLATIQNHQGDLQASSANAERAEALARQAGTGAELALALILRGWSLYLSGESAAALALGEEALAQATAAGAYREQATSLTLLGGAHDLLGQFEQAQHYNEQALALARQAGDQTRVAGVLNNLGASALRQGDYPAAASLFGEALTLAHTIGDRDGEMVYLNNLGGAQVMVADHIAAEASLRQAIAWGEAAGMSFFLPDAYRYLAEALLGQGRPSEALAAARQAVTLSQETGQQDYTAPAWRVLGLVLAAQSDILDLDGTRYDAVACFAESLRICAETGMEGERAHTLRAWAVYECTHGDPARGNVVWQEAREIFARLGIESEVARMENGPV